jgi:hypothetical protein
MTYQMNLQNGLVGHWTMDDADTSGGTLYDSSGYDYHGSLSGGVTTGASGIGGSGLSESYSFDGTDDEVTLPNMGLSGDQSISISVWHKVDSSAGTKNNFFGFGTSGTGSTVCSIRTNGMTSLLAHHCTTESGHTS